MLTRSKRSLPFGASIPSKIQKPPAIPLLSYINKRNLIYTFSIESANTAIESAKIESYIGFDIEWKIQWKRGAEQYKTALIQICTSTEIILFHISRMKSIPISLLSLLTNPNVLKTGVGIKGDAFRIHRDFNIEMKGIVDLAQCFKQFPDSGGWNLQSMLERYCKTSLDKDESVRKGNWEREPLNEMQIEYAANDAFASYLCTN